MFEARLPQAATLKRIIDPIKELVNDANLDCNDSGISMQAMDGSHIAMSSLQLRADGFDPYRCDRNLSLGINLTSFSKILKCAGNDDVITMKADDDADILSLMFEGKNGERVSQFDLKLLDIDSEHVSVPEQDYDCDIKISSAEFAKICRDLSGLGQSMVIDVTKEGVRFSAGGEIGNGSVMIKQGAASIDDEKGAIYTRINMREPVSVTLSLKFLNNITKATPLSETLEIHMTDDLPVLFQYNIGEIGHLGFYLAPQIPDEE
ncbi:hypothetical protein EV182_000985 [Spiromyces aspiralis]|uniref:Uncharacterized protein n=1 Tax=Spiromyces aspiralis TaxID=68401 RepID=A0ACC1HIU6_9FUNG|nr:hypothetical protein EV182_000985 [Spiromyces aspiralis]